MLTAEVLAVELVELLSPAGADRLLSLLTAEVHEAVSDAARDGLAAPDPAPVLALRSAVSAAIAAKGLPDVSVGRQAVRGAVGLLVTVGHASNDGNVSARTVRHWAQSGRVTGVKTRGGWLVAMSEVRVLAAELAEKRRKAEG